MTDKHPLNFTSSPLSGLIRRAPAYCAADTPIRAVLQSMRDQGIGSMIVCSAEGAPVGIFTVQDALARVALGGTALDAPISAVIVTPDPAGGEPRSVNLRSPQAAS